MPPALEAQSLNHWTTREVPRLLFFDKRTNQPMTPSSHWTWSRKLEPTWGCPVLQDPLGHVKDTNG